jgi:cytochrome c oxidase assembly factor CtaG
MLDFFVENPVIAAMALLVVLLVLALPIGIIQRRYFKDRRAEKLLVNESRFMGTGMDLALLFFAMLILAAVVGAAVRAFSGF